ncbi:MAG: cytochrome c maturation protein CcmE [Hyphomicrobiales bacterium]|nr:cytochrome c maturation protein CcmE [Hyphomicrobiales bacterium]
MKPKHKRLTFVVIGLVILAAAAGLALMASEDALVFFHTPSEIVAGEAPLDRRLRIGGLVEEGSVKIVRDGQVTFRVTDMVHTVPITYSGILPDLFREGQGVVAEGRLRDGIFVADQVLAKHDENYMPPEVADALKQSGQWQHMREEMEGAGQVPRRAAGESSSQ